eukprot:TRINITY_DN2384_c0_g1_i3.p1 TRINITY_DN2384_c0_g1~~TRINITY_DN2384_c0_g1_i3.p1  ORF type:complete len:475 (+),score=62.95 TRINITY_DN2384_c0_g1_i3:177-1601(+)
MEKRSSSLNERGERRNSGSVFLRSVSVHVPASKYYDTLEGPELETIRDGEDVPLPPLDEKWPFLLRFPNACFGMCMGLASQASLWKALSNSPALEFLHVPPAINLALWTFAVFVLLLVSATYILKTVFHREAVRREFSHPVRVNFFFAPLVASMNLAIAVPPSIAETLPPWIWWVFMAPLVALELKIYGQWLSGGERRLSRVANPTTHISVVGNFVGSLLAARLGWTEPAKFLFAVGLAHYLVLFVTLYQRLPSTGTLPKELHPVYFLFLAAPSTASWAWQTIFGEFDTVSRILYFVVLFIYTSLVVRFKLFLGFRFSISWWAYTYPMTSASIATIRYTEQVTTKFTQGLSVLLSLVACVTVFSILITTILHAFVWKTLFPNDLAIALITEENSNNSLQDSSPPDLRFFDYGRAPHRLPRIRKSLDLVRDKLWASRRKSKEMPVFPETTFHHGREDRSDPSALGFQTENDENAV